MKYCGKCLAKNGDLDFLVMTLQTVLWRFSPERERERERERVGDVYRRQRTFTDVL